MRRALACLTVALLTALPATAQVALVGPDEPGGAAPAGRSALAAIFPDGLPYPFEAALDAIRTEAGVENIETTLIPLGRSSQRMAAHPDFFASPRIVATATGDWASGPGALHLADRLFLGYQPAAQEVLAIGWNEEVGRFEFERVTGYGPDAPNAIEPAPRAECIACHQGHAPVFPRPLWRETTANPAVVRTLSPLGTRYLGTPIRSTVDGLFDFDEATDRAARLYLAQRLWSEGCETRQCRAILLADALRFGLNGRRPDWEGRRRPEIIAFEEKTRGLWPAGLSIPSPDLPDRDPVETLGRLAPSALTAELLAGAGKLDPSTPRPATTIWHPARDGWAGAVRAVADMLADGDSTWIDGLLGGTGARPVSRELTCNTSVVEYASTRELRFDCAVGGTRMRGFMAGGAAGIQGRIDHFEVERSGSVAAITAAAVEADGALLVRFPGQSPRVADGRRLSAVTINRTPDGAIAEIELVDDFGPLAERFEELARGDHAVFDPGPVRRELILDAIARATES